MRLVSFALLLTTATALPGCNKRFADAAAALPAGQGKAMAAYRTILELAPRHARAAELQGWFANPSEGTRPKPV
jgi:hypothetical protein